MNYTIAQESRIGGRPVNQDRVAWLATADAVLMVVADGMGGHLQGEVAAQIAVDTVLERFRSEARTRLADPPRFLAETLRLAHETIVRYAADCRIPIHAAPRTTCIACVVQDGQAAWAHAGDSRLFLVHSEGENRVSHTRDHSIVQRMVDAGKLTPEQAVHHPLRSRVFSCLGGDVPPHIEVSPPVSLQNGDLIALCTDGAWFPLGASLVHELGRAQLNTTVPHLLDAAERAAGPGSDNLSLIALRWEAPELDAKTLDLMPRAAGGVADPAISDADMDLAIAEIRRRIPLDLNGTS